MFGIKRPKHVSDQLNDLDSYTGQLISEKISQVEQFNPLSKVITKRTQELKDSQFDQKEFGHCRRLIDTKFLKQQNTRLKQDKRNKEITRHKKIQDTNKTIIQISDKKYNLLKEKKEQNNHLLQQERMQRQEDHLEQENILKEEEDKDDENDDKDSDDDVEIPISKLRFCMVQNLTELTKQFLAEKPDTDLRHGRGFFFGYAIEKNNPELPQLYIDTFQRNYIDRKQKESEVAGKLARFKLRKYLQKGLEYTDDFDQIDDVLVVLKKYIPLDDSEIDRTQDIENDFPKDMKNFTDLSN
ncbi:hypothetical protein ABPG74_003001 [Tetrahymena malaccensis]